MSTPAAAAANSMGAAAKSSGPMAAPVAAWPEPVRLTGRTASLVPLSIEHEPALAEAVRDGELWKLSEHLPLLLDAARDALSDHPLFLLLTTYSDLIHDLKEPPPQSMIVQRLGGACDAVELGLRGTLDKQWLPCGTSLRWRP